MDLTVVAWWCSHHGFRAREMSGETVEAENRRLAWDLGG